MLAKHVLVYGDEKKATLSLEETKTGFQVRKRMERTGRKPQTFLFETKSRQDAEAIVDFNIKEKYSLGYLDETKPAAAAADGEPAAERKRAVPAAARERKAPVKAAAIDAEAGSDDELKGADDEELVAPAGSKPPVMEERTILHKGEKFYEVRVFIPRKILALSEVMFLVGSGGAARHVAAGARGFVRRGRQDQDRDH